MYQLNKIQDYIEELVSLETMAEVFTEVAQMRLLRVRVGIERNRRFVEELTSVLHVVRVMGEEKGLSASRKKKVSASLLITSNKRIYYGALDARVTDFYVAHTAYTGYVDRFVIGSVGMDILKGQNYPFSFTPVPVAGEVPNTLELANLARELSDYQQVVVYYPRFMSVLWQQPSFVDVTGLALPEASSTGEKYYIFEPEVEKITAFFEGQIMAILLEQIFLETQLARIGTQLMTMDAASLAAENLIKSEEIALATARRQLSSMKVLEMTMNLRARKMIDQ